MRDLALIRRDACVQREQALTMRYRARRQRRRNELALERVYAPLVLDAMRERDLSALEDVRPPLRLLPGGRR